MSDVMLFGVLRMPFDMAMGDEVSRYQYWTRGKQAADEIERNRAAIEELVGALKGMMEYAGIIEDRCDSVATDAARAAIIKYGTTTKEGT